MTGPPGDESTSDSRSWDYRVVRSIDHREPWLRIHYVYYDDAGEIRAWSRDGVGPEGDTEADLRQDLANLLDALKRPILDLAELEAAAEYRETTKLNKHGEKILTDRLANLKASLARGEPGGIPWSEYKGRRSPNDSGADS